LLTFATTTLTDVLCAVKREKLEMCGGFVRWRRWDEKGFFLGGQVSGAVVERMIS
jgi:hypothetical protein